MQEKYFPSKDFIGVHKIYIGLHSPKTHPKIHPSFSCAESRTEGRGGTGRMEVMCG